MNIAILSTGPKLYSTMRLKEAGEKRGHKVEIIDHMKCVLYIEKQNPIVLYQGRKLDYFDAVFPRIAASVTFYGAAVVRQFEMMKVFTCVESQALIRSRDKLRSLQILSRAGLGIPKTIFMDYSKETEGIIEERQCAGMRLYKRTGETSPSDRNAYAGNIPSCRDNVMLKQCCSRR